MSNNKFTVSASPHVRGSNTTQKTMATVVVALLPAVLAGIIFFGLKAAIVIAVSVLSCLVFEFLFCLVTKKKQSIGDLSAVVTGVLLGLNMPSTIPLYLVVFGAAIAIIVVKMLFGGLGYNFLNPALTARLVLLLFFQTAMSNWVLPMSDGVAGATPLISRDASYIDLLIGKVGGSIGETSAIAILIGFAILWVTKTVKPQVPLAFMVSVMVFSLAIGENPLYAVLSGGVMLGAVFMATDYTTSVVNKTGGILYGLGAGMLTVLIRKYMSFPEGVSIAILLMNLLVTLIRRITIPIQFGGKNKYTQEKTIRTVAFAGIALVAVVLGVMSFIKANSTVSLVEASVLKDTLGTFESLSPESEIVKEAYKGEAGQVGVVTSKRGFVDEIVLYVVIEDGVVSDVQLINNPDDLGGPQLGSADYYASFIGLSAGDIDGLDAVAGVTVSSDTVKASITEALAFAAENE